MDSIAGRFRLLVDPQQHGARNMAVDDALLRAMSTDSAPVLRLYGFAPPCLSLGRFQPRADAAADQELAAAGVTLVRRPTGGQAVLHHDEVTYAVVMSRHHVQPFTRRHAYRAVANLLVQLLAGLGAEATVSAGRRGSLDDPDCFRVTGEYEISGATGAKLVGSAQTTARNGVLQHGSLPLSLAYTQISNYLRPAAPPDVPHPAATSLAAESGKAWAFEQARDAMAARARDQLGATPSQLSEREIALAVELEAERYQSRDWTLIR